MAIIPVNCTPKVPRSISGAYTATPARAQEIRDGAASVSAGFTKAQVIVRLGQPDEVRPAFEPKIKNPRQIAETYWYILSRKSSAGSAADKDEHLVRITFDLSGKVMSVDQW